MGAIGAALLVHESVAAGQNGCKFRGFDISGKEYQTTSFECKSCPSSCEIVRVAEAGHVLACWGGQCDLWEGNGSEVNK